MDPELLALGTGVTGIATASSVVSDPVQISTVSFPDPQELEANQAGAKLPLGPRFSGSTFVVPVVIHSGGQPIGSYNASLFFDPDVLQVLGVAKGTAPTLGAPVHNGAAGANDTGELRFNAVNEDPDDGAAATGDGLHVASVTFRIADDAPEGAQSEVSGTLEELFSTSLATLGLNMAMVISDGSGNGEQGAVQVRPVSLSGLLLSAEAYQLVQLPGLPGAWDSVQVHTEGVYNNGDVLSLSLSEDTGCVSTEPNVIALAQDSCVAQAADQGGSAAVQVTHGAHQASLILGSMSLQASWVQVSDPLLQPIVSLGKYQSTRAVAQVRLAGAGDETLDLDVSSAVTFESTAAGSSVDSTTGVVTAASPGKGVISARLVDGTVLAQADIEVTDTASVELVALSVLIPGEVTTEPANPSDVSAEQGKTGVSVQVSAFLDK